MTVAILVAALAIVLGLLLLLGLAQAAGRGDRGWRRSPPRRARAGARAIGGGARAARSSLESQRRAARRLVRTAESDRT